MTPIGRHTTADYYGCQRDTLNDLEHLQQCVAAAVTAGELHLMSLQSHRYDPEGVAIMALLRDGHLSIHTYPEIGFIAVDLLCCDPHGTPEKTLGALKKSLLPEKTKTTTIKRGDFGSERDMKPRTKTHAGTIRRVKDTGSKMLKFLSRKT